MIKYKKTDQVTDQVTDNQEQSASLHTEKPTTTKKAKAPGSDLDPPGFKTTPGFELVRAMASCSDPKKEILSVPIMEDWFTSAEWEVVSFFLDHLRQYGVIPSKKTVIDKIDGVILSMIPKKVSEPPAYYLDQCYQRYITEQMSEAFTSAVDLVNGGDPVHALDLVSKTLINLPRTRAHAKVYDVRDMTDAELDSLKDEMQFGVAGAIETPWPTLNKSSTGFMPGDLAVVVGRTGSGKSWLLLKIAYEAWQKYGKRVMLVSMEMTSKAMLRRLYCIHTKTNPMMLKEGLLSDEWKKFSEEVKGLSKSNSPLWVLDGAMTARVDDLKAHIGSLEPDMVIIDGAYLIGHHNKMLSRFERVTEVVRDLKTEIAMNYGLPVVASYQFNREAKKKPKSEELGTHQIGLSDEIGQLSSIALGIDPGKGEGEDADMFKKVYIMKSREGIQTDYLIDWDFELMSFSEAE